MPRPTFYNLPEEKRSRVTEVAIEEFSDHGFRGASISRIVARSDIAKGSFYQYFDNKADLFEWLLFDVAARRKIAWLAALPDAVAGDFWAVLARLLVAGIGLGLANPRLSRMAADLWHPSNDPEMRRLFENFSRKTRATWRNVLELGMADGHIRADLDLDVATEFLIVVLQDGLDLALQRKLGVDLIAFCSQPELALRFPEDERRTLVDAIVDLCRRALGSAHPPDRGMERIFPLVESAWGLEER
jgi:TetR/AcrR family transcriptional regulator